MAYIWSRTESPSGPRVSVTFEDGSISSVGNEHANIVEITQKLAANAPEAEVKELLQPVNAIAGRLQRLSERVTTDGKNLFFDGDALHDSLAEYILQLIRTESKSDEKISWKPFVNFLEKLALNPSEVSRKSLYTFIAKRGLTVTPDGDFLAYKGIREDFTSVRSGPGIVNDVPMNGNLPNKPGSILEMARTEVNADVQNGCAVGLHVGTFEYARDWARGKVVAVAVNPRDVVAVPFDGDFHKVRVARYEVLMEIPRTATVEATIGRHSTPVYNAPAKKAEAPKKVDEKIVEKLRKAIKRAGTVKIRYTSKNGVTKSYIAKPTELETDILRLVLPNGQEGRNIRSFTLTSIVSVKKYKA